MAVEFGPPKYQRWIGRVFAIAVILGVVGVIGALMN
jgi:hypothetical protein